MKRKICVWSGKRGGFGALKPTMNAIQSHPNLELDVVVTDQHLYNKFGKTITEVEDSFPISDSIDMEQKGDSNEDRAKAIGKCLIEATNTLSQLKPDILLVIGDRGEVFAACIAAHNMRIPIAHIQGGDLSGSLDEPVRHAITKLAHIHLASTKASANRIRKMGEDPWRIHIVGDTHIDQFFLNAITPEKELRERYKLNQNHPFILVLQHSDSTEPQHSSSQMKETIIAVTKLGIKALFVYPCSDQGYEGIIGELEKLEGTKNCSIFKNIPAQDFMGLQKLASCLVGNSSAGIIEAPYFNLPAVNIGNRQLGRERAGNVIDVDYDNIKISNAILKAMNDKSFRKNLNNVRPPYGNGKSYKKITKILASISCDDFLLNKRMTY